jgi:CHAT domain-containing protein/tetratricopeptide (TPR) repeat protein
MGRSLALLLAAVLMAGAILWGFRASPSVPEPRHDALELQTSVSAERQLKPGAAETFTIRLRAGDFLRVVVDQQGLDVVVSLEDPGGRRLLEVDSLKGALAPELVEILAETTGLHRLRVRALRPEASGRYAVRVEALRPASPNDRLRARAAQSFAEGESLKGRKDFGAARKAYLAALRDWQAAGETLGSADAWARLGDVERELSDLKASRASYQEAVALYGEFGGPEEIRLLNELGKVCRLLADPRAAEEAFQQALLLARGRGDQIGAGDALINLGVLYNSEAEPGKALDAFDEALAIWKSLGNRSQEATTLHNLGTAYTVLGRFREALKRLERAQELRQEAGDLKGQGATLTAIAWVHALDKREQKAIELFDEALRLRRAAGDWRGVATTLDRRGSTLAALGRKAEAFKSYGEALKVFRKIKEPGSEAQILVNLGRLFVMSGDALRGEQLLKEALPLLYQASDRNGQSHALLWLAHAARQRGNLALALERVEQSVALVDALRSEAPGAELRSSYAALRYGYRELWIDLLMAAGFDKRALEASEESRVRGFLERRERESAAVGLGERARGVEARIRKSESMLSQLQEGNAPSESIDEVKRQLGVLLLERDRLRSAPPEGDSRQRPQIPTLGDLRGLLGPDTLLLEYAVGEERSFLWLMDSEGLETWELPGRSTLESQVREAHKVFSNRQRRSARRAAEKTATLGSTLLGPLADRLRDQRLLIVPDGILHEVPFAALTVEPGGAPLLANHEVVLAPSASAIAVLRREQARRTPAPGALGLVADPVYGAEDPRLRSPAPPDPSQKIWPRLVQARKEAEFIESLLPPAAPRVALFGFAAERKAILDGALTDYRIVHFATHAEVDPEHPELSNLVLTLVDPEGRPLEGRLYAYEIRDLHLSADMVVLSACSTGVGRELRGEGPLALSRAFLEAGAARVVVSLWDVQDDATAELMRRFYQSHLAEGQSPARALRQAQLSMSQDSRWSDPYYWAGFVLQGEWQ